MTRTLVARRQVDASPEVTWRLVSDPLGRQDWDRSVNRIDMITPGPARQGSRYRMTRSAIGITNKEERQVTGFFDGAAVITRSSGGVVSYDSAVVVIPRSASSCEVVLTMSLDDESTTGKVLGMAAGIVASQLESLMSRALGDLAVEAHRVETLRPPPGPAI